jgi:hypothetical protein
MTIAHLVKVFIDLNGEQKYHRKLFKLLGYGSNHMKKKLLESQKKKIMVDGAIFI